MNANDRPVDAPGFRIIAQLIADLEFVFHKHFAQGCPRRMVERHNTSISSAIFMRQQYLLKQCSFSAKPQRSGRRGIATPICIDRINIASGKAKMELY